MTDPIPPDLLATITNLVSRVDSLEKAPKATIVEGAMEIPKTPAAPIPIEQLIDIYNEVPAVLSAYVMEATVTADSYQGKIKTVMVELQNRGTYWIILDNDRTPWLFLNPNRRLIFRRMRSIALLFSYKGEPDENTNAYFLEKPAQLRSLFHIKQWELVEKGTLDFTFSSDRRSKEIPLEKQQDTSELTALLTKMQQFSTQLQNLEKRILVLENPTSQATPIAVNASQNQATPQNQLPIAEIQQQTQISFPQITLQCIHSLSGHRESIQCLTVSQDGKMLVSGSSDKTIKLWDITTKKQLRTVIDSSAIGAVAISGDSKLLASANQSNAISIWNLETAKYWFSLEHRGELVNSLAMHPTERLLISSGRDATLCIWDLDLENESSKPQTLQGKHQHPIQAITISPDGKTLASGDSAGVICIWDLSQRKLIYPINHPAKTVSSLVLTNQGLVIAAGGNMIHLWNLRSAKTYLFSEPEQLPSALAIDRSGTYLAGSFDRNLILWHLPSYQLLQKVEPSGNALVFIETENKNLLASASTDKNINLWMLNTLNT